MEWRTGRPDGHGYYLGAWRSGDRWIVSELWFNPDSTGSGWWSSRGYLVAYGTDRAVFTVPVVAWAPMPVYEPPGADPDDREVVAPGDQDHGYVPLPDGPF